MAAHGEKKKKSQKQNPNHLAPKSQKPFKRSKKEKIPKEPASTDSLSTSLLVQDDDPEFPRGGGSVLSRKEEAEARAEAEAEFEKEKKEFRKGKDRRKKKNERKKPAKGADDELGSLFGEGVTGRLPKFANRITLKNISPNMKLWGVIVEVNQKDLVIGLPGGLRGFVRTEDVSDIVLDNVDKDTETYILPSIFHVGQLVSCIVLTVDDDKREGSGQKRIWLSLHLSLLYKGLTLDAVQDGMDDVTKIGSVVSGIVERLTASGVILHVDNAVYMKGMIPDEHLTDHRGQAMMFKSLLRPGYKFDQLLVLDIEGQNLVLSAKYSLLCSLQEIPSEVSQIRPLSVLHGYICNVIEAGCFVRFLGRLTGFSPKYKVADEKIDNLLDAFSVGQSVRSYILNVNSETGRIKLSLKQSLCFSTDVSFIQSYFLMEEKIAKLQFSDAKISDLRWLESFNIGAVVEGEVQEMKEFGSVLSFKDHPDIVGFIANQHLGGSQLEKGSVVKAFVLDIAKSEGLVDLSLKTELVDRANIGASKNLSSKKKRRRDRSTDLELQQTVNTIVEIVKENYLVLSIPEHNYAIGYASLLDYNTQKLSPRHFHYGQSVVATVGEVPSPDSLGRLLLLLKCTTEVLKTSSSKRTKKAPNYVVGSLVDAEVIDIKPLELVVKFGTGLHGRVHITEVAEDGHSLDNMLSKFRIGQLVNARIVSKAQSGKKGKGYEWELSLRPSVLSGSAQMISGEFNFSVGNIVSGYVSKVDNEWVWLTVSRNVRAHIYILDSSSEPSELQEFGKLYTVGRAVEGRIIGMHKEKRLLRLCPSISSLADRGSSAKEIEESNVSDATGLEHIMQGDLIGGRIKKVLPGVGGLLVQIGPHRHGRVHYTELLDTWASNPLSRYEEGQFVKCKVLEISRSSDGLLHVDLSLRTSLMGINSTIGSDSM
ncbi:uncharacterized protein A4U43_C03F10190 [Asparagus officinalis]|uniref:S1 motif domain-containing protein n=1 Tax=Asparagus officinalis TaxID=4686 RepID=A0A5P1F9F2_ASPOF|nr:uncharacterized protein A4U43_C03F10190 [Asparagus officinalis]